MAKCIRCGKSTVIRGHVKLEDAAICTPCWKSLGFKITETAGASVYRYDDIKDGRDMLSRNLARRRKRHEEWMEEHPEVAEFMAAIDEGHEEESPIEADPDEDDLEKI